jgi:hypothetical protein
VNTGAVSKVTLQPHRKAAEGRVPRVVRHQKAAAEDSLARWDGNRLLCGGKACSRRDIDASLTLPPTGCGSAGVGCAGFTSKNFSLQSETKRNEIRFACVSHAHAKKKKFPLYFASFRFQPKRNKYTVFSLRFASKNFSFSFISLLNFLFRF